MELKQENEFDWKKSIKLFDARREIIVPGNAEETIIFCVKQFIQIANEAIRNRGFFSVALSGGNTPNAIFTKLSSKPFRDEIDWSKVLLFWSDERSVPPTDKESNYHAAMEAGLKILPLTPEHIHRMQAEVNIEENARDYEKLIKNEIPSQQFDLIMLGVGEDGHTASLFPYTDALEVEDRLVLANHVPQKETWRMTLTYACIEKAKLVCLYALGKSKAHIVEKVLFGEYQPKILPAQRIGTETNRATWILDDAAANIEFVST